VVASLIKQLSNKFEPVHPELESAYNREYPTPNFEELLRLLMLYSRQFLQVVLFLDAYDETDPAERPKLLRLIEESRKSGLRTCVTVRKHLLKPLLAKWNDAVVVPISANSDDVNRFLTWKLSAHVDAGDVTLDEAAMETIVRTIESKAGEM
jgi:hypothetical protein